MKWVLLRLICFLPRTKDYVASNLFRVPRTKAGVAKNPE